MSPPNIVVVAKYSAYRRYLDAKGDWAALREPTQSDAIIARWKSAHEEHEATMAEVERVLRKLGAHTTLVDLPHKAFSTRGVSLVLTVGGDGTLIAASHHVDVRTPILGVNSAPSTSFGFFCGLKPGELDGGLERALRGSLPFVRLARMQASLDREVVSSRVLNDALFCHACPAATSRYSVLLNGRFEDHKSSGFWVGPAAGSTAALRSAGGRVLPFSSRLLQFVVREPFRYGKPLRFAHVVVREDRPIVVRSRMPDGKLFLDGPHMVVDVELGGEMKFAISDEPLTVLGITRRRGRSG